MYKINDLIGKKVAIYCNTKKKASKFLKECENLELCWRSGAEVFSKSCKYSFSRYGSETCFSMANPTEVGEIEYSPKSMYKEMGYQIVDFEEIEM